MTTPSEFPRLRPFQSDALATLAKSRHVICVSSTGSGKSLIYERFARDNSSRMLLVTPLLALARQQSRKLREAGVVTRLGAGDQQEPPPERSGAWIVSPEKLFNPRNTATWRALRAWCPDFLVVDECHCLWEWGGDFRPSYSQVPRLIRELKIPRSLWLTATLPPEARKQLREELPGNPAEIGRFNFPENVALRTLRVPTHLRMDAALAIIGHHPSEPGIVFTATRAESERWARFGRGHGLRSVSYHAGMCAEERRATEGAIRRREIDLIAATSAFGMGMDFPHLRWVVFAQPPATLLSLAQAAGRVGRGKGSATSYVLWNRDDFRILDWSIRDSARNRGEVMRTIEFLESGDCRVSGLRAYFDGEPGNPCGHCDACAASDENTLNIDILSASIFQNGRQAIQATK